MSASNGFGDSALAARGAWCVTTIIATLIATGVAIGDPPMYRARLVTPGVSAIAAAAVNESADIVGTTTLGGPRAWVAPAGQSAVLLPLPSGSQYSWATDINDAGVVVGVVGPNSAPEFGGRAVAWTPDAMGGYGITVLGALPGHTQTYATAINNVGDVVGYSSNGTFRYAVLFDLSGGIQDLSATGVFDPADVNDQRVMIDHSFTCKRLNLDTMVVQDLGTPGISYLATTGAAINEFGQVAGLAILTCCSNCDRRAARYSDSLGWEVLSACGYSNGATDINDLGDVVMRLNVAPYVRFEEEGTYRVEDLIVADVGHWYVLNYGPAINNSRQMAIGATNSVTGETGVLLLTPVRAGDVDGDGDVDLADLALVLSAFGACNGNPAYEAAADFDQSGCIDLGDLAILLAAFGT